MNLKELEAQYKKLGEEIAKLKEEETKNKWPKIGDTYWFVELDGNINYCKFDNVKLDHMYIAQGNIFRTKQEAEAERDARAVVAELMKCESARKYRRDSDNFRILIRNDDVEVCRVTWHSYALHVYFDTEKQAEAALESVRHDRVLRAAKWLTMGEVC